MTAGDWMVVSAWLVMGVVHFVRTSHNPYDRLLLACLAKLPQKGVTAALGGKKINLDYQEAIALQITLYRWDFEEWANSHYRNTGVTMSAEMACNILNEVSAQLPDLVIMGDEIIPATLNLGA